MRNGRRGRRGRMLPLLAILALVLPVSTGCRSVAASDSAFREILTDGIPVLPSLPPWPDVEWTYGDGWYRLDEEDADKVLDWLENGIPAYKHELDVYGKQLDAVLDALRSI